MRIPAFVCARITGVMLAGILAVHLLLVASAVLPSSIASAQDDSPENIRLEPTATDPAYEPGVLLVQFSRTVSDQMGLWVETNSPQALQYLEIANPAWQHKVRSVTPLISLPYPGRQRSRSFAANIDRVENRFSARTARSVVPQPQRSSTLERFYVVSLDLPEGADLPSLAAQLARNHEQIISATPNYYVHVNAVPFPEVGYIPNDFHIVDGDDQNWREGSWEQTFPDLWGHQRIQLLEAFDQFDDPQFDPGSGVVVATVDTGIDYNHPDIAANVWTNPFESVGDANEDGCPGSCGIDDDGDGLIDEDSQGRQPGDDGYSNDLADDDDENGFPDDIFGWDFGDDDGDPLDGEGHGTHVAGTIAAVGNNTIGIIGVAPNAKLMGVKAFPDGSSSATFAQLAGAIRYAVDQGADVINNSWSCTDPCPSSPVVEAAVLYAHERGVLITVGAGNTSTDVEDFSPQNMAETLTVGATNFNDQGSSFSNFGDLVDVSAPGGGPNIGPPDLDPFRNILSLRGSAWSVPERAVGEHAARQAGTSMACPHVSGLAALVLSRRPELTTEEIHMILRVSADAVGAQGEDGEPSLRRINALQAMIVTAAWPDCNGNGVPDSVDIANADSADCNGNGTPDECEPDSDQDGVPDDCDICEGDDTLIGMPCDSDVDADDCPSGVFDCASGTLECTDDDEEDDADGDGVDDCIDVCGGNDALLGQECDSEIDADECASGIFECASDTVQCTDDDAEDDADGDGIDDCVDTCNGDQDLIGLPCDSDVDSDDCATGVFDCSSGTLLCTDDDAEDDADGDGVEDCNDICDGDNNLIGQDCDSAADPDDCASGVFDCSSGILLCTDDDAEDDADGDGVDDCDDLCDGDDTLLGQPCDSPLDADTCLSGTFACVSGTVACTDDDSDDDADGDGVFDCIDNCPNTGNPGQEDSDGDGVGDMCTPPPPAPPSNPPPPPLDTDNDGVIDDIDACPETPDGEGVDLNGCSESQLDDDGDSVANNADQCPGTEANVPVNEAGCSNAQRDDDGDGVLNPLDACPQTLPNADVDDRGCSEGQLAVLDPSDAGTESNPDVETGAGPPSDEDIQAEAGSEEDEPGSTAVDEQIGDSNSLDRPSDSGTQAICGADACGVAGLTPLMICLGLLLARFDPHRHRRRSSRPPTSKGDQL